MAYSKQKKESKSSLTQQTIDVSVTDTSVVDNTNTTDNEGDSKDLLSESTTVESDSQFDSIESVEDIEEADDDDEGVDFGDKISFNKLRKKYQIGRDTLYKRIKYLRIAAWKVSGKACYDAMQVAHLDGLHEHMQKGKKIVDYPIPEPTGPSYESTAECEPSSSLVLAQNDNLDQVEQSTLRTTPVKQRLSKADIVEIRLDALERVKTKRLAVIEVTRTLEENPDLIPLEIQQEIEEAEMAAISTPLAHKPYYDPKLLAQLVIQSL
jgi:hypothetical protein